MPPAPTSDPAAHPRYTKSPGTEPIPGYVLLEPLGRGGFGEVWKCEAPGGLLKAVKFVTGEGAITDDGANLRQEYAAFQQIKAIRHPFLLSLERVELIAGELVMVMELADRQLGDRFQECLLQGLPGIPRAELLGYFEDAAEALDEISTKYGLQHLDVKPANLFLTAGHVQVGDYGLVSKLDRGEGGTKGRGLTPRYVAPEVLLGQVHTRSDQYSLALVYQELLTGTFPYTGRTPQQLMIQHASAVPDLSGLPERDREAVGRALAKGPEDRFPSCSQFVQALVAERSRPGLRLVTPGRVASPTPAAHTPSRSPYVAPGGGSTVRPAVSNDLTHPSSQSDGGRTSSPPRLVATGHSATVTPPPARPSPATPGRPPTESQGSGVVVLNPIQSVVTVARLLGRGAPEYSRTPAEFVRAVCQGTGVGRPATPDLGAIARLPNGTWSCRFMTAMDPRIAQVRLDLLWEEGGLTMDTRQEGRVVFWKEPPPPPASLFGSRGKKKPEGERTSGFEVVVQFPEPGYVVGEVTVTGGFFGSPPAEFVQTSERAITRLMAGVLRELNNFTNRRAHPRMPADFPVTLYPLHSDGRVGAALKARCRDVSAGGVGLVGPSKPSTRYAYVAFDGMSGTAGAAVLVKIAWTGCQGDEVFAGYQFRLDLSGVC